MCDSLCVCVCARVCFGCVFLVCVCESVRACVRLIVRTSFVYALVSEAAVLPFGPFWDMDSSSCFGTAIENVGEIEGMMSQNERKKNRGRASLTIGS